MAEQQDNANKGTIDPGLLAILCCPETKLTVTLADNDLIQRVNTGIGSGTVLNKAGQQVKEEIDGGLIREDQKVLYPIRDQIPIMLIEEGIVLDSD
ncbi:MAG: Trm112 family protein [Nitrospirales bacterium]